MAYHPAKKRRILRRSSSTELLDRGPRVVTIARQVEYHHHWHGSISASNATPITITGPSKWTIA